MKLRSGIDVDGVLVDQLTGWLKFYRSADHTHDTDPKALLHITSYEEPGAICGLCFSAVLKHPDSVYGCDLYEGLKEQLELARLHVDMTIVTHRTPEVESATLHWLEQQQVRHYFADVVINGGSKAKICYDRHLHYHVDDSPNVAEDFARFREVALAEGIEEARLPQLLFIDRSYNRKVQGVPRFPALAGPGGALEFLIQEGIAYNDLHA